MNHFLGSGYSPNSISSPPPLTLATLTNTIEHLTNDVKHHLPKSIVDLAEKVGREDPSKSNLDTSIDVSRIAEMEMRLESLQQQVSSNPRHLPPAPLPQAYSPERDLSGDMSRLEVALTGGLSETDSRLHNLELPFDKIRDAFSNTATLEEVEDLRDEVVDALEAVKAHKETLNIHKHQHNRKHSMEDFGMEEAVFSNVAFAEKENHGGLGQSRGGGSISLKDRNSIMDEVAISRPDRR